MDIIALVEEDEKRRNKKQWHGTKNVTLLCSVAVFFSSIKHLHVAADRQCRLIIDADDPLVSSITSRLEITLGLIKPLTVNQITA